MVWALGVAGRGPGVSNDRSIICLIRPPAAEAFRFSTASITLPLGLAYISAALKRAGLTIHVVDAVGEAPDTRAGYCKGYLVGLRLEQIVERIPAQADIIGITVVFTHEWPMAVRLIDLIRRRLPDAAIVIGGEHVTSMPELSLLTSKADIAVLGEGEETVVELALALRNAKPLADIAGIAYRRMDGVRVNPRRERQARIDDIATPDWESFSPPTYHRHRFVGGMYSSRMTVPILATRGCPYQCTYCSAPNMWLPRWIPRDPIKVVDEIESYVKRYGAGNFPFQDLTAIIQKDWIKTFCQELIRRNLSIQWQLPTGTRSEAIDPEVARLLKASGMTSMAYAPESGSDLTRRLIKKKMTAAKLFESIDAAADAGLNVAAWLVIGFPHDRPEHLAENLPFLDELARHGVSDIGVAFYMALPGTELFNSLYDAGRLKIDRKYFRHILDALTPVPSQSYCDALSRTDLAIWKFKMFRRFYGARKRDGEGGLVAAIRRALRGLFRSDDHASKLETVARNALTSGLETIRVRFSPRYMTRADERAMFASWDAIYRQIREQKLACDAATRAPADTTELHRANVIPVLAREHATARTITAPA
jgi:anaerobic magnesium-protoporphyrin IX monomethyl ester cyclase